MYTLEIHTVSPKRKKTRTFRAALLQSLALGNNEHRPIYLSCAGSAQELRAFVANIRLGRRVHRNTNRYSQRGWYETPKTASYRWEFQPCPGDMAIATGYVPELFELEPTTLPERVEFVLAAPRCWIDAQAPLLAHLPEETRREAAAAGLFASHIDRRTRLPLINDIEFHWQLWKAAQEAGWCTSPAAYARSDRLHEVSSTENTGLEWVRWVSASQHEVEECVASQTQRYLEHVGAERQKKTPIGLGRSPQQDAELPELVFATTREPERREEHGPSRVPSGSWVFPDADGAAEQLSLFGEA